MTDAALQHVLIAELKDGVCRCGKRKASMSTFCYGCYDKLPRHMKTSIYKRIGDGYAESYQQCIEFLTAAGRIH